MSFPLSALALSLPSSIHNRKPINHFGASCSTKFSVYKAWESKCVAAAKKKNHQVEMIRLSPLQVLDYRKQALKQVVANCYKLSDVIVSNEEVDDDLRTKIVEVYSMLKSELFSDPALEWTDDSRQWVHRMMDYNILQGDLGNLLYVLNNFKQLKDEGEELSEDELLDASVVAMCTKWLETSCLILDDFTDSSVTRHDKPCWFRVPKVGSIALNDAILLMSHVPRVLKKHFGEKPYYVDLLGLFNEVVFQTTSGQMLDLITPGEERDLSSYTMHLYRQIAKQKAGYIAYLPVACALLLAGENLENHENMKDVVLEMGIHFQKLNDYLDCFGNPKKTGKIGTDIEAFKCSWLIVKALELANEEQIKILQEHYGKANPSDVAKVKAVYNEINLQGVFAVYESECFDKLGNCVEAHPNKALHGIWATFARYREWFKMQDSSLK